MSVIAVLTVKTADVNTSVQAATTPVGHFVIVTSATD